MVPVLCLALGPLATAVAHAQVSATTNGAASGAMPDASRGTDVRFVDGLLTVSANNASLNGLLREVAQRTGMRVSGSVREERVFGTYGPAEPARVISLLLDGTGNNVLLVQSSDERPRELVLTRRTGGVSPPDPNAAARAETDDANDDDQGPPTTFPQRRGSSPRGMAPVNAPGFRTQTPNAEGSQQAVGGPDRNPAAPNGSPSSTEQPVMFPPVDATTPPATASSTPADNVDSTAKDTKTPQQIFEELQRLRQQPQPTPPQ